MIGRFFWRLSGVALIAFTALVGLLGGDQADAQDATPTAYSCETAAMPIPGHIEMDHGSMDMATPAANVEFDQAYIDMMIPHHASIVALSQAALPRLHDERLRMIAENVISAQTTEIAELRGYREQFYGSGEPMPVDDQTMMQLMPGMSIPMDAAMAQMDAATQVSQFCAADEADLAFIDLVIPHHVSAIAASEAALQHAEHDEIRTFAQRVIADQQREIAELTAIRLSLSGSASPEAVSA